VASETGATPVYGRRMLCLHEVISKVDQRRFNQTCRATRQSGRCPYYPGRPRAVKATSVSELKDAGARTSTCPYEIQLLNLSASTALVATHRQLGLIGWLLAKWRWSRERTILVLGEGVTLLRAGWPYGDNLRAWLVKGLTTKFERRDERMVADIRWVLGLAAGRGGRALVFLPSFEILYEAVRGVDVLHEERGLSQESVDRDS
jgi:hypothetical protein